MKEDHFEVLVLGTGPSGGSVAEQAAEQSRRVAIADNRQFGGTCALRGCNPKKVYTNAGQLVDRVRRGEGRLVTNSRAAIDWTQLLRFKQEFTEPVEQQKEASFRDAGIETFHGDTKFTSDRTVVIGDRTLSFDRAVIATGATPRRLSIPGENRITHSDDFLELPSIPERVVFIGGGYISMEFAHVVARCNKHVTVIERGSEILDGFDPDLIKLLRQYSQQQGIEFQLGHEVREIAQKSDDEFTVVLDNNQSLDCGLVVHGAGRVPNLDGLELNVGGVKYDSDGIEVNDFLQSTSNPAVFATGDCAASGMPRLTPVANEEARIVAKNLFAPQPQSKPDYGAVPKVVFTTPAIAAVGLSQRQAEEQGRDVKVQFEDTSSWGSVRKTGDTCAGYKVLVDKQSDLVVGAHLLGPGAEETINLYAMAMKHGLTATDIKSTLFAFPTFASDVRRMV